MTEGRKQNSEHRGQMTEFRLIWLLVMLIMGLSIPFSATAQKQAGDIELGVGAAFGPEVGQNGSLAVSISGYYSTSDNIRAGVDFQYYFMDEYTVDGRLHSQPSTYEYNINVHYFPVNRDRLRFYTLLGFQYSSFTYHLEEHQRITTSQRDVGAGFNVGGGVEYALESILFFAEPKYTISGLEQLSISAGGRIYF